MPRLRDRPDAGMAQREVGGMSLNPEVRSYLEERKLSQSFLARMDVCPKSAYLYAKTRAIRVQTPAMARGEAFHDFAERAVRECISTGELAMDPDTGRELMDSLIAERADLVIPHYERDALRGMAWNFCAAMDAHPINPGQIAALEAAPELKVGDWTVTGRIDRVEVVGRDAFLRDYKTSLSIPSQERFDQSFQLRFYALLWAEGSIDGKRVGEGLDGFHIAEEYPRFLSKECADCGKFNDHHADDACKECGGANFRPPTLFKRRGVLGKRELHDFRRHIEGILAKLDSAVASGNWPASPGPHCVTCAAPSLCPLPRPVRPASLTTPEEAEELAQDVLRIEQDLKRDKRALKEWAGVNSSKSMGFKTVHIRRGDEQIVSTRFQLKEDEWKSH